MCILQTKDRFITLYGETVEFVIEPRDTRLLLYQFFFLGSRDFKKRTLVLLTSPRHSPIVNTPSLYNRHPKNPPNTPTNALNKTWASKKVYKKDW